VSRLKAAASRPKSAKTPTDLGLLPSLLGYRLRLAQRAIFTDFVASMGEAEISPGLFGILVIIEANPGLKQTELAIAAHLDLSSVVPVVDKLEARGYVSRRASAIDRRVNGLWLTPEGGTVLRKLKRTVLAHERRIARQLTGIEQQQLFDLLAKLLP
jgi:DNA-binding MarR family transcriptional regulator